MTAEMYKSGVDINGVILGLSPKPRYGNTYGVALVQGRVAAALNEGGFLSARVGRDGSFFFVDVPPGDYLVAVVALKRPSPDDAYTVLYQSQLSVGPEDMDLELDLAAEQE